jgi:hypothetical protein
MLTPLDVAITGDWIASAGPNQRWAGELRCDRPCVALLVATTPERWFWAKTEVCTPAGTPIILDVHPLSYTMQDTQLILVVRGGWIQDLVISPLSRGAVVPKTSDHVPAGVLFSVFTVEARPSAKLALVFLAREDVRMGRSGLWRPHARAIGLLPTELTPAFAGGRSGSARSSTKGSPD